MSEVVTQPKKKAQLLKVRAVQTGYYQHKRRRPGTKTAIFEMSTDVMRKDKSGNAILPNWVVAYNGKPESISEEGKKSVKVVPSKVHPPEVNEEEFNEEEDVEDESSDDDVL